MEPFFMYPFQCEIARKINSCGTAEQTKKKTG